MKALVVVVPAIFFPFPKRDDHASQAQENGTEMSYNNQDIMHCLGHLCATRQTSGMLKIPTAFPPFTYEITPLLSVRVKRSSMTGDRNTAHIHTNRVLTPYPNLIRSGHLLSG